MDDPLFLHHGESPSTVLVTQPLTSSENYSAQAQAVRKALLTKNKLGFIDGTLTLSSPLVSTLLAVQAWIRCDNMVGTQLTNSISPKLQASIIYEDIALEIQNDLRDHLAQKNGPRIYNLKKEIVEFHQGEVSITNFFTQLKVLWDQLHNYIPFPSCTCGKCTCNVNKRLNDLQARESVMNFLMGLNESFSQVRTYILLMESLPSINKVYSLMIQEEIQRCVTNGFNAKVELAALIAKSQNFNGNTGVNYSGNNDNKGKDKPICTVDKCYKLHRFPPSYKFKGKNPMAHQVSLSQPQDLPFLPSSGPVTSSFTPEQYQQLLALISTPSSPLTLLVQGKEAINTTMCERPQKLSLKKRDFWSVFKAFLFFGKWCGVATYFLYKKKKKTKYKNT